MSAGVSSVFDAVPAACLVFDAAGTVLLRNPAAKALLDEGATVVAVLRGARAGGGDGAGGVHDWAEAIERCVSGGEAVRAENVAYEVASFPPRRLDLTFAPVRVEATGARGGVLVAEDVTEVHSLSGKLAEVEAFAGSIGLVSRVAHELTTRSMR